jgi:hypothetical protein
MEPRSIAIGLVAVIAAFAAAFGIASSGKGGKTATAGAGVKAETIKVAAPPAVAGVEVGGTLPALKAEKKKKAKKESSSDSSPSTSNSTPSAPETSEPAPSNPAPSNPAPSNPAPSNPAPSNPAPSKPKPPVAGQEGPISGGGEDG